MTRSRHSQHRDARRRLRPPTRRGTRLRAGSGGRSAGLLGALLAVTAAGAIGASGCSDDSAASPAPPVAGLEHIEVARVGAAVQFSAAPTAVAAVDDAIAAGARIVRFEFTFADGSPRVETAAASVEHVFAAPGTYAVSLRVVDDAGRSSEVSSSLTLVADHAAVCGPGDVSACPSGRCAGGVCVVVACAGDPACSAGLRCVDGFCAAGDAKGGDVHYGHDGARTPLDATP